MDWAIRTAGLGKEYLIRHRAGPRYVALRDVLGDALRKVLRNRAARAGASEASSERFWALKEISFDVRPGERVGIIGRNGAGKSTLLKILGRITDPSVGRAVIRGRVASLLEVGTGFHPELTGRENVYLNGAILGMRKAEIHRKFEEIVTFSGVEKFLDTPVKRYSSGMHVRLAFSVAAHLESEILIVDEVLAVGDAEFQAKCLARMEAIGSSGRTILFVSHNLSAVQRLCGSGIFLNSGRISVQGPISGVLEAYQKAVSGGTAGPGSIDVQAGQARFAGWRLESPSTHLSHSCTSRDVCRFVFRIVSRRVIDQAYFGLAVWDAEGKLMLAGSSLDDGGRALAVSEGEHVVVFEVRLPVKAGHYQLDASLNSVSEGQIDRWHAEPELIVLPSGDLSLPENWHGLVNEKVRFEWVSVPGK